MKPNDVAGLQESRRVFLRPKQCERRAADDLPAAWSFQGIDAGLLAGDPHRTCRDLEARRTSPRSRNPGRHSTEIRKAGSEANHVDEVVRSSVNADDFFRG